MCYVFRNQTIKISNPACLVVDMDHHLYISDQRTVSAVLPCHVIVINPFCLHIGSKQGNIHHTSLCVGLLTFNAQLFRIQHTSTPSPHQPALVGTSVRTHATTLHSFLSTLQLEVMFIHFGLCINPRFLHTSATIKIIPHLIWKTIE